MKEMEPVNTTTDSFTCESCGAPLTSLTVPCPYCGHMPSRPVQVGEPTETVDVRPVEVAVFGTSDEAGISPSLPSAAITRGLRDGCIVGIIAALIGTIIVVVLIWIFVSAIIGQANSAITGLIQEDPTASAAADLGPLTSYMQDGEQNDAAAGNLFMHSFGVTVPSQADLAAEFARHTERYSGFQSVRETGFVRVHSYGGNGDYWEVQAVASYADGPARVVYADQIQHDGWKLYEVTFPDEPVP